MLKLFLALNIILLNLSAAKSDFESCKLKIIDSNSILKQNIELPVEKNRRLIFSKNIPNAKIIKHDPFLSLFLVEDSGRFKYPFVINNKLSLPTAVVDNTNIVEGKIAKEQAGLNSFAKFTKQTASTAILTSTCCCIEGLVTPKGIIEKKFVERFLEIDKVSYSDIGIRVVDENSLVTVKLVNPFVDNNPFKIDDLILELDDKRVKNSAIFMRNILFSKVGSTHKVKIKRGDNIISISVNTQNRVGGGYLSDTFLESLGIFFDENLNVVKLEDKAMQYSIKLGDQLLQVDGKDVSSDEDVSKILSNMYKASNLLFTRGRFQFFIRVN